MSQVRLGQTQLQREQKTAFPGDDCPEAGRERSFVESASLPKRPAP